MSGPEQLPYVVAPGCVEGDVRHYGSLGFHLFCVCHRGADGFFSKEEPVQEDEGGTYIVCPYCRKRRIRIHIKEVRKD